MRLDFKALWIEDQPEAIASQRERIELSMRGQGFRFQPEIVESVAKAKQYLSDGVFKDNVDLVLVDFTLGAGPHGNDALREVREQLPYREIIFYSANAAANLKKLAFEADVQGVYCTSREELIDTTLGVFETLIKKALDLDHVRGIVMGATSDIDNIVSDALLAHYGGLDGDGQSTMRSAVIKRIDEKVAELQATAEKAKSAAALEELFELHGIYTAIDKLRLFVNVLKDGDHDEVARKKVTTYITVVLRDRNILGHVAVTTDESGQRVLRGRNGKELSEERLHELRRELLDHRENIQALAALFGVPI